MRIRDEAATGLRAYLKSEEFVEINTPVLTSNDAEGAGEQFKAVKPGEEKVPAADSFFGSDAYLTCSGQLDAEIFAMALSRVYSFGPTFRAESSNTPHHLAEFWMLEPEVAFADLSTVVNLSESMIKATIRHLLDSSSGDFALLSKADSETSDAESASDLLERLESTLKKPFAQMTYTEAVSILEKHATSAGFKFPVKWGLGLQREHERWLAETHLNNTPVVVTHYPKNIKAFYMKESAGDPRTVDAFDLLMPRIGELIGGSAREDRHDVLLQRMADNKLEPGPYRWYLDLRKYGSAPHAGFGMGFERFLQWTTCTHNIRDVVPVPRHKGFVLY
jgi:asparaginyl-tRNA synthetase